MMAAALGVGSLVLVDGRCHSRAAHAAEVRAAPVVRGVWVWTRKDEAALGRARAEDGALAAAVHVATVSRRDGGEIVWTRALAPAAGDAIVARLDDSLHAAWDDGSSPERLARVLAEIVAQAEQAAGDVREVELDYDAPVLRLDQWAEAVDALVRGPLRGRAVWVTSIPAHLEDPRYGAELSRAGIAGHVIQVFDTGLPCSRAHGAELAEKLAAFGLPFRVGVAAFERAKRPSEHACWRTEAVRLAETPGWSGFFVFPGGEDVRGALASMRAP